MSSLNVQLLWWEGCPSTEKARELVRAALDELGQGEVEVELLQIETDEQARRHGFVGSPTILIDNVDLTRVLDEAADAEAEPSLTCRLYRRRDGRISPTPDPADVREALARAVQQKIQQRSD